MRYCYLPAEARTDLSPPPVGTLLSCETAVRSPSPPPRVGAGSGWLSRGSQGSHVGVSFLFEFWLLCAFPAMSQ